MKRRLLTLKIMLAQERKKATALGVLVLLLGVVAGRAALSLGPRTGRADAPASGGEISSLASAGRNAVDRALASDDALRAGRTIDVARSPRLTRNLFALDPEYFPPPTQPTQDEAPFDPLPPERVESPAQNADDEPARREAQLVEETTGWRLSSVLLGQHPTAVVETDGPRGRSHVLRAGNSLNEWVVVEITSSTVVFEKQSVRVRLSLAKHER